MAVVLSGLAACARTDTPAKESKEESRSEESRSEESRSEESRSEESRSEESLSEESLTSDSLPAIATGRPCDSVKAATAEIDEQSRATIPLVTGLTLTDIWVGPDSARNAFDHECLTQVTVIDSSRVVFMSRCSDPKDKSTARRRTQICRGDLRAGSTYRTQIGPGIPDLVSGSTMSVLSRRAFRELRDKGSTVFRQIHLMASSYQNDAEAADPDATVYITEDLVGRLRRTGTGTTPVQVNDSLVELPVIRAEVTLRDPKGSMRDQIERLVILDDERVPVVLDNQRTTTNAGIRFIRITWPQRAAIEEDLVRDRTARIYGLYFDSNSSTLRAESADVLAEIADVLTEHPDWRLLIEGHTDSLGGSALNQPLSLRRATAVRAALVERHGIDVARLDVSGLGDTRPVDRNDTVEGRARNRRVELIRPIRGLTGRETGVKIGSTDPRSDERLTC